MNRTAVTLRINGKNHYFFIDQKGDSYHVYKSKVLFGGLKCHRKVARAGTLDGALQLIHVRAPGLITHLEISTGALQWK